MTPQDVKMFGRLESANSPNRPNHNHSSWGMNSMAAPKSNRNHFKHGDSSNGERTTEYRIWIAMRRRCQRPTCKAYPRYGGRGISVCERWESFTHFLADMGRRPSSGHSLDRIDNDGPYSPENCRWATSMQQGRNSRRNRLINFNGETLTLSEWTERRGFHTWTIGQRLREGWTIDRAITTPERGRA